MELLKIIVLTASCWATLTIAANANRDQDLFWAARGKKAISDNDWADNIVMDPFVAAIIDKRDGSVVPFWAARGKKFALEPPEAMPFWAARGKKGNIERREEPLPFWAARGKRIPTIETIDDEDDSTRREKRSPSHHEVSLAHAGQHLRNRPVRPAAQAFETFWAARGKKSNIEDIV